jgi:hypothetical protein
MKSLVVKLAWDYVTLQTPSSQWQVLSYKLK